MTEDENATNEMTEGTDGSELNATTKEHEINIPYNGKVWKFLFRRLTWDESTELLGMMQVQKVNRRTGEIVNETAYKKFLKRVYNDTVKKAPVGFRLDTCDPQFGNKLMGELLKVSGISTGVDDIQGEEIKN